MGKIILLIIFTFTFINLSANRCEVNTLEGISQKNEGISLRSPYRFNYRQIIAPTLLVAAGSLSFYCTQVKDLDKETYQAMSVGHEVRTFDDFLQYSPVFIMWGMDALGMKPRHRFKQQTTILALSAISVLSMVYVTKTLTKRVRPDSQADNSFPSGHTATAFMGAEILRQEFGHHSPWIGIAGYTLASATAFMRVYNSRHWATDTLAGAGVGILGAKIGYWLAPKVNGLLWGSTTGYDKRMRASLSPFSYNDNYGVALSLTF